MADPVVLSSAVVWLGGYALEGAINEISITGSRAELDNSRMGDDAETFYPGIQSIDAMVGGFWKAGTGEPDTVVAPRLLASPVDASDWPLTVGPPYAPAATAGADGNLVYTVRSAQFAYEVGASHGESLPFKLTSRVRSGSLYRQTVVLPKATYAATTTGTGRQLGILGATQKLVTVLHVFAINGGSWVLTVESDDNAGFTTPTVRQTFTAVTTAPNRLVVETLGPIATDDRWRVVLTKTGGTSIVAAASLSLENI